MERGFKGLIVDRSKTHKETVSQIYILSEEFQKVGNSKEIPEGVNQFSEGEGYVLPDEENPDHPHSKMSESDGKEKEERPKRKRRGKANPMGVELELSGKFHR